MGWRINGAAHAALIVRRLPRTPCARYTWRRSARRAPTLAMVHATTRRSRSCLKASLALLETSLKPLIPASGMHTMAVTSVTRVQLPLGPSSSRITPKHRRLCRCRLIPFRRQLSSFQSRQKKRAAILTFLCATGPRRPSPCCTFGVSELDPLGKSLHPARELARCSGRTFLLASKGGQIGEAQAPCRQIKLPHRRGLGGAPPQTRARGVPSGRLSFGRCANFERRKACLRIFCIEPEGQPDL
jgi:hypothetical protein